MNSFNNLLKVDLPKSDGIYFQGISSSSQQHEIERRAEVANSVVPNTNLLDLISKHHSIPVMDREVRRFISPLPAESWIVDVGGCWGWHWRDLYKVRPDIKIVIVDLVKENLEKAKSLLGSQLGKSIFLVCGDALSLPFSDGAFNGYWSVQTLQHIEKFYGAIEEAYRVLANDGRFATYSLNHSPIQRFTLRILGKSYHKEGYWSEQGYYLKRASPEQKLVISDVFQQAVESRFSEIIFAPEFGACSSGRAESLFGSLDASLTNKLGFLKNFARQESFHTQKHSESNK